MLEFFRRHRGPFMITLTAIIIITFAYWGGSRRGLGMANMRDAHDTAFTLYGRTYSQHEAERLARAMSLCYQLGMYDLAFQLPAMAERNKSMDRHGLPYDFIGNLLVLREKAVEFGVACSEEEAKKKMETLPAFQGRDGKFDQNNAADMISMLNARGFSTDDLVQLVKDQIIFERLRDLVAGNYSANPHAVALSYSSKNQTIKAQSVILELEEFKKKAEVKDDEIKKYYDENKERYMTPEKRAGVYVFFEKPKPDTAKTADENVAAQTKFDKLVGDFDNALHADKADITTVVTAFQKDNPAIKLQTLAAFEQATPPEAIKEEPKVIGELFRESSTVGQISSILEGTKGYYFTKVTQIDKPKQQELKEVTAKVKDTLVTQKAQEAMLAAANEARKLIDEGLKKKQKLEDIAKGKTWKVATLPDFTASNPAPGNPDGKLIADVAAKTAVGSVSEKPESGSTGAVLVVVNAKELLGTDTSASQRTSEESQMSNKVKEDIFKAWFGKQRDAAKMEVAL